MIIKQEHWFTNDQSLILDLTRPTKTLNKIYLYPKIKKLITSHLLSTIQYIELIAPFFLFQPDVGAPITANDRLWGITSGWTSNDCLQNISPTVFNRVSFPLTAKWIETTLNVF